VICFIWTSKSWPESELLVIASRAIAAAVLPGVGWEFLHVAIDDHSRIAFSDIQPDECGSCLWQLKSVHFGSLFWPTPGREHIRAIAFPS